MTLPPAYDYRSLPVRQDLADAIERAWQHLAGPGTWWTREERLLMVAEARNAEHCPLCRQRKAALSPHTALGSHNSRPTSRRGCGCHPSDSDRRKQVDESWLQQCLASGLADAEYVGDRWCRRNDHRARYIQQCNRSAAAIAARAVARQAEPPPTEGAKKSIAWVPTLAPKDLTPDDVDPFIRYGSVHIQRARSLFRKQ